MKKLIVILFMYSFTVFAKGQGGGPGPLSFIGGERRQVLGGTQSQYTAIANPNLQNLKESWGINVDHDIGYPLGLTLGFNYFQERPFDATWKGTTNTSVEMYGWTFKMGLKMYLPGKSIQPWFLLGGAGGLWNIAKPSDRIFNDYRIAYWDVGSQVVSGPLLEAGFDIMFSNNLGLRLSGQVFSIWSKPVSEFGNKTYEMNVNTASVGIIVN